MYKALQGLPPIQETLKGLLQEYYKPFELGDDPLKITWDFLIDNLGFIN